MPTTVAPKHLRLADRLCAVRAYIRHHASRIGAPRDLEDKVKAVACRELLAGASAWRALKHALAELDRRTDHAGWFGLEGSR